MALSEIHKRCLGLSCFIPDAPEKALKGLPSRSGSELLQHGTRGNAYFSDSGARGNYKGILITPLHSFFTTTPVL
jgi:hypothetical protein